MKHKCRPTIKRTPGAAGPRAFRKMNLEGAGYLTSVIFFVMLCPPASSV